jgi:hypothetical protein
VTIDGLAAGPEGGVDFITAATDGDSDVAENQMRFIDAKRTERGATLLRYRPR